MNINRVNKENTPSRVLATDLASAREPKTNNKTFSNEKAKKFFYNQEKKTSESFEKKTVTPLVTRPEVTEQEITEEIHNTLERILESLQPIDFSEEANLKEKEKLSQKHLIVITIRQILNAANELNLGLLRNQAFLHAFNGEFWSSIEKEDLEKFLSKCAIRLGINESTAEYHGFIAELFKQFFTQASKAKTVMISKTVLVNLKNGTFEVTKNDFSLREFRRDDFLTYQLDFDFDETADCPKWHEFLNKVLPDLSCQDVLAEYIGYIFAKHLKLEKTLFLFGTGANGKSVVFDVINALLGRENVSNYSLDSLCSDYYRAMIGNKLLNYSSEASNRLQTDRFKQLTSGEPVEARLPYGKPMTLRNYARLAFNSNELPKDVEHSEAFFRRFLLIPFSVTIPENERNPHLAKEIIENELSGVFNWVIDGLNRLLKNNRFSSCEAGKELLEKYKKDSDSVLMFLEDENYQSSSNYTSLRELYQEYKSYCSDNGYRALGRNKFGKRLEANGISRQDRNQPVFYLQRMPKF